MPKQQKTGHQSKDTKEDNGGANKDVQHLEAKLREQEKALRIREEQHRAELQEASTALGGETLKHYRELLDENESLRKKTEDLEKTLNEPHQPNAKVQAALEPTVVQLKEQKQSAEEHTINLINQKRREKEDYEKKLREVKERRKEVRGEIALAQQQWAEIRASKRGARQKNKGKKQARTSLPAADSPVAPPPADAFPTLQGKKESAQLGSQNPTWVNSHQAHVDHAFRPSSASYSTATQKASQSFKFVKFKNDNDVGQKDGHSSTDGDGQEILQAVAEEHEQEHTGVEALNEGLQQNVHEHVERCATHNDSGPSSQEIDSGGRRIEGAGSSDTS